MFQNIFLTLELLPFHWIHLLESGRHLINWDILYNNKMSAEGDKISFVQHIYLLVGPFHSLPPSFVQLRLILMLDSILSAVQCRAVIVIQQTGCQWFSFKQGWASPDLLLSSPFHSRISLILADKSFQSKYLEMINLWKCILLSLSRELYSV